MSSTTRKLLAAYAEPGEAWKLDFDDAQACLDLEETLAWGMTLFRGLAELEANLQRSILDDPTPKLAGLLDAMPTFYDRWLWASEQRLAAIEKLRARGYKVNGLDDFMATLDEARAIVGNLALEEEIVPIESTLALAESGGDDPSAGGSR